MGGGNQETIIEAVKSSPPVTVIGLTLGGIPLQEWVYILTIVYLLMQIGWLGYSKVLRKAKAGGDDDA